MRMIIKRIISFAVFVAMMSGCNGIGNPEGDVKDIKLEELCPLCGIFYLNRCLISLYKLIKRLLGFRKKR